MTEEFLRRLENRPASDLSHLTNGDLIELPLGRLREGLVGCLQRRHLSYETALVAATLVRIVDCLRDHDR